MMVYTAMIAKPELRMGVCFLSSFQLPNLVCVNCPGRPVKGQGDRRVLSSDTCGTDRNVKKANSGRSIVDMAFELLGSMMLQL